MKSLNNNKLLVVLALLLIACASFLFFTQQEAPSLVSKQDPPCSFEKSFKQHNSRVSFPSIISAGLDHRIEDQLQELPYPPAPLDALSQQEELDFPGARVMESAELAGPGLHQKQHIRILQTHLTSPYVRTEEIVDSDSGALLGRLEMVANQLLVVLAAGKDPEQLLRELGPQALYITPISESLSIYQIALRNASVTSLPEALEKMEQNHYSTSSAEPNYIGHLSKRASNLGYPYQWGLWKNSEETMGSYFRQRYMDYFYKLAHGESDYLNNSLKYQNRQDTESPLMGLNVERAPLPSASSENFYLSSNKEQNDHSTTRGINAAEGWDIRTSASSVVVSIIDSGIRANHENLKENIWVNPQIDSKKNDLHGYNARENNGNISDQVGHGTHCAGIIGATASDQTSEHHMGVAGVAWKVQLMACKCTDTNGSIIEEALIRSIDYAKEHGAMILNCSLGWVGASPSIAMNIELNDLKNRGIILVAAAGNDGINNDVNPLKTYPASYSTQLDNIISVAATDYVEANEHSSQPPYEQEGLASFSNYGEKTVSLAAPGTFILSTSNKSNTSYVFMSGTSMAAPYVTGALALMKEEFPKATYQELINHLIQTTDFLPSLEKKMIGGRLNLAKALSTPLTPINPSKGNAFSFEAELTDSKLTQKYKLLHGLYKRNDPVDKSF